LSQSLSGHRRRPTLRNTDTGGMVNMKKFNRASV